MEQNKNTDERLVDSGKVGFHAENSRSSDQKHKSSIGFKENLDNGGKSDDQSESTPLDAIKNEVSANKKWSILKPISANANSAKPSNKLSEVGQYNMATMKEIDSRRKTMFASQSDLSGVPSITTKHIDFPVTSKDDFSFGNNINHKICNSTPAINQVSRKSTSTFKLSDNIAVKSMAVDLPRSVDLPENEADAYANALEDVLNKLELIRYRIPAEIDDKWDESYKTLSEKCDVPEQPNFSLRQYLELPPPIPGVFEKLQKDRTYIHNVLKDLVEDLRNNRRYDCLDAEIEKIVRTKEDKHSSEINHEIWTEQVDQLVSLIKSEKNLNAAEIKNRIDEIHQSAADIDDAIRQSQAKLEYVKGWEEARLTGQKLRIELQEQKLQEQLAEIERDKKIEEIVSEEICAFLQQDIDCLQGEYQSWVNKFNEEIDDYDLEIEQLKRDIKRGEVILEKNLIVFKERQEFIDECVERERKDAQEKEYWDVVHGSAKIIQALWRGYMVRKQIGPYKGLWKRLKKRKKLAAKKRIKMEARRKKLEEKKAAEAKKKPK